MQHPIPKFPCAAAHIRDTLHRNRHGHQKSERVVGSCRRSHHSKVVCASVFGIQAACNSENRASGYLFVKVIRRQAFWSVRRKPLKLRRNPSDDPRVLHFGKSFRSIYPLFIYYCYVLRLGGFHLRTCYMKRRMPQKEASFLFRPD